MQITQPEIEPELEAKTSPLNPPPILSNLVFGINEVAKRLEAQIQHYRHPSTSQAQPSRFLRFVFACIQDIDPPSLIEHLPPLIAAVNASRPPPTSTQPSQSDQEVILVPLPKMAEGSITEAVKLRRVAVFGLDVRFVLISSIYYHAKHMDSILYRSIHLISKISNNSLRRYQFCGRLGSFLESSRLYRRLIRAVNPLR